MNDSDYSQDNQPTVPEVPIAPLPSQPQIPPQSPIAPTLPAQNPVAPQTENPNTPGTVILQWLTYAFWGWTILVFSLLVGSVMSILVADADTGYFTTYALAAVLVLLPISLVCDFLYGKKEPEKKTGAATIVMVIHAVIFALFGIGSLIFAVFSVVMMFTSKSDSGGQQAMLYSSLITTTVYAAIFARTLNPPSLKWLRKASLAYILVLIIIISVIGVFGPIAKQRTTRNDKLIEQNLNTLPSYIENYSQDHGALPESLNELDLSGDAKQMVDSNLVTYKPEGSKIASNTSRIIADLSEDDNSVEKTTVYYYQLCATYKKENKDKYSSEYLDDDKDGYSTYIASTSSHSAGKVCYKLKTRDY